MPELPEVHIITMDLNKYVVNSYIKNVTLMSDYNVTPNENEFIQNVKNHTIVKTQRIAKNIVLELSSGYFMTIHLAMTGKLLLRKSNHSQDRYLRMRLHLQKNNKQFELRFCDMRMFGKVGLVHKTAIAQFKQKYGPEPLDDNITPQKFLKQLQLKKTNIKNALLDQRLIAGMGNVYVNDALWIAKIHPQTKTVDVDLANATKLLSASKEILKEGIKNRGISMSDYVDLFGKQGNQQNHFRVYRQTSCSRCKSDIELAKINGRKTYFCPNCQVRLIKNQATLM